MSLAKMPPSLPEYRSAAAIIGLGETDYGDDYAAARAKPPGYTPPAPDGLAAVAFERALADAGFDRKEIDGLAVAFLYGGPSVGEVAQSLELKPRYTLRRSASWPVRCRRPAPRSPRGNATAGRDAVHTHAVARDFSRQAAHEAHDATERAADQRLAWRREPPRVGGEADDRADLARQVRQRGKADLLEDAEDLPRFAQSTH